MIKKLPIFLLLIVLVGTQNLYAQEQQDEYLVVRSVSFVGNKITKEFVIRREMNLQEGDSILVSELEDLVEFNRLRILNSQLFVNASARIYNQTATSVDIEYTLKELFYWNAHPFVSLADRNFNVWYYDFDHKLNRLNIGADINRKNFRGRGEEIGIEGQVGFNKHLYLYYSNPYIDKSLKNGIKASIAYNTGKEIHSETDSNRQVFYRDESMNPYRWLRAEFSYLFRPDYAATHELRFAFHHYDLSHQMMIDMPNYLGGRQNMSIPEIMYRYRYNNTDDRNYPMEGWEIDAYADQKGWGLVKDFNQWQVYLHLANYQPLYRNLSTAIHFRGRLFGPDNQPYFNYRAMGFKNDFVRGFEYYIIDGSHYGLLRTDLRQKIFHYDFQQNIIPIVKYVPIDIYAKTYLDGGYVYSNNFGNSFLNNKMLYGYGVGVDIVFSYYLKARIEYSFNSLREKGLFLNFRNE